MAGAEETTRNNMKVEQSNPTVIEIQTNTLDEKQIRKRFETLGKDEEVYLVLHIDRQSDKEYLSDKRTIRFFLVRIQE